MSNLLRFSAAIIAITVTTPTAGAHPTVRWEKQFGGDGFDDTTGVAVDTAGNVYVTGCTSGSLGEQTGIDAILRKYDSTGTFRWSQPFSLSEGRNDWGHALAVREIDSEAFIYVAGPTIRTTPNEFADVLLARFDSDGNEIWKLGFGSSGNEDARGVAIDGAGNVYVAGTTDGAMLPGAARGGEDAFLAKYDSNGNEAWVRQLGTSGGDTGWGIAIDGAGSIFITGETEKEMVVNGSHGDWDAWLAQFDVDGNQTAMRQIGSAGEDGAYGIAATSDGRIYLTGYTTGLMDSNGSIAGGYDAWVAGYNGIGNLEWTRQFGGGFDDYGWSVAVDSSGDIFIGGETHLVRLGITPRRLARRRGTVSRQESDSSDAFLIRFDSAGNPDLLLPISSAQYEACFSVTAQGPGEVCLGGVTWGDLFATQAGEGDAFVQALTYTRGGQAATASGP